MEPHTKPLALATLSQRNVDLVQLGLKGETLGTARQNQLAKCRQELTMDSAGLKKKGSKEKGSRINLDVDTEYLCIFVGDGGGALRLCAKPLFPFLGDAACHCCLFVWVGEHASDSGRQL